MDRLAEVGLKLNTSKCQFICQEVAFLGHVISPQGLKTSDQHVKAVEEFPVPTNVKGVRQFIGMASFYRRFVNNFARVTQPLHALTRKGAPFKWTGSCQEAFELIKKKLCEAPILAYPSFTRAFVVAILSQVQEDGRCHPVAFASRALSPAEKNYSITDLETLAVAWALAHFRIYLYGQKVTVYTVCYRTPVLMAGMLDGGPRSMEVV